MSSRKIPQTPWSQAQQDRLRQEVPKELRSLKQWVVWKVVEKTASDGKTEYAKLPHNAKTGELASTTNPDDWNYFEVTLKAYQNNEEYNGVGFVFGPDRCYTGIDLDNCRDPETKKPNAWAAKWLTLFNSYTEVSPSGRGYKVICRGSRPDTGMKNTTRCEVYDHKRYFTITGRRLKKYSAKVEERREEVALFVRTEMCREDHDPKNVPEALLEKSPPLLDEEVRSLCRSASNAQDYCDLWNGKWEKVAKRRGWEKASASEADLALCNILAFYTQNPEQILRLIGQSKLYRDKWEREDYQHRTINKALEKLNTTYAPMPANSECVTNLILDVGKDDKKFCKALRIEDCAQQIRRLCGDWPRRCGKILFCNSHTGSIRTMMRPSQLFAWLHDGRPVRWFVGHDSRSVSYVQRESLYDHYAATATNYRSIEDMPHVPERPGSYYSWHPPEDYKPTGEYLAKLLRFFDNPETPEDKILIKAMFLTPAWGGPCGKRPAFVVTSKDRGYGKSTLADTVGLLYGGAVELPPLAKSEEDFHTRLLSPQALTKRVVRLDNLSEKYGSAIVESFITGPTINGYQLYEGDGERPNTMTTICTGTAVKLSKDMADRSFFIELRLPERKSGWDCAVISFVAQNQNLILADIVAELKKHSRRIESSSRWITWVEEVLTRIASEKEVNSILELNGKRQDVHDEELEDAELIRGAIFAHLKNEGLEDEKEVFIESQEMVRVLRVGLGENLTARTLKFRLDRHIGTQKLQSLRWMRKRSARGYKIDDLDVFLQKTAVFAPITRDKNSRKNSEKHEIADDFERFSAKGDAYASPEKNKRHPFFRGENTSGDACDAYSPLQGLEVIRDTVHMGKVYSGKQASQASQASPFSRLQHLWSKARAKFRPHQKLPRNKRHKRHPDRNA